MTDAAEKHRDRSVPGQPDMWTFVLFETLFFTGYFGFYLFYRARNPDLYLHAQSRLDLRVGLFNAPDLAVQLLVGGAVCPLSCYFVEPLIQPATATASAVVNVRWSSLRPRRMYVGS